MSDEKTVTERKAVVRERRAFLNGVAWSRVCLLQNNHESGAQILADAPWSDVARKAYPGPSDAHTEEVEA